MPKRKQPKKKTCQLHSPICSGQMMVTYGVNGSEKEGQVFAICGPCAVYLRRGGSKLKQVSL